MFQKIKIESHVTAAAIIIIIIIMVKIINNNEEKLLFLSSGKATRIQYDKSIYLSDFHLFFSPDRPSAAVSINRDNDFDQ